jgi:N-acetylglutamate synthase-like GNAT family acetyltransferase
MRDATIEDAESIHALLSANADDASLFQQPLEQVRRTIDDFLIADDVACAAVHVAHGTAEILAVAVRPDAQGKGAGKAIMSAAIERARSRAPFVWLATAKPMYFARFGFTPMTKWRLPLPVLIGKLRLVFHQPTGRWIPALVGRHTFMKLGT